MTDNTVNNKRIAKNTAFLYIRMFFVLIVSLYTSRIVLNTLGVDDYGVYNVVAGFVSMFGFLNVTLSSSMQRFYNYEGSIERESGYHKVYATGLIIHLFIAFILFLLLETFGLWYVNNVMVVPEGRMFAVNFVFQTSVVSMMLVILQIPYTGAIMADERMDYYAIINIVDVVLKLLAVISLPFVPFDKLISYGCFLLLITLFDTVAYFAYAKRKVLSFKLALKVDKPIFKSLMSFSGWNLLGTFAFLLKGQGVNMLLNSFFGTVINAAQGIAYQVNGAINGFSANLSTAFRPQIVNSYAQSDHTRTKNLFFLESKACFALMAILMVPAIIEIKYLLRIWLGDIVPDYTGIFATLVLVDSLICTLNTPCTQVAYAVGDLKKYQIITSAVNLCLLPVCWVFLRLGFDSTSVFVVTIFFSILNQTVCLVLLNKLLPYGLGVYLRKVCMPCVMILLLIPIVPMIIHGIMREGLLRLVLVTLSDAILGLAIVYQIVLSASERSQFSKYLSQRLRLKGCHEEN